MRAISAIAYGCAPHPFTRGDGPQETDKRLVSAAIEGRPMVFLDNANLTILRSDTLASLITEQVCAVRPLGRSQMIELEIASFFAVTGNGGKKARRDRLAAPGMPPVLAQGARQFAPVNSPKALRVRLSSRGA
jgi:hypothetical protein